MNAAVAAPSSQKAYKSSEKLLRPVRFPPGPDAIMNKLDDRYSPTSPMSHRELLAYYSSSPPGWLGEELAGAISEGLRTLRSGYPLNNEDLVVLLGRGARISRQHAELETAIGVLVTELEREASLRTAARQGEWDPWVQPTIGNVSARLASADAFSPPVPPIDTVNTHGLEIIPPHELPGQLRVCYRGVLSHEEAQAKLGNAYRVLEVCPAQCLSDDGANQLVAATEVIFGHNRVTHDT